MVALVKLAAVDAVKAGYPMNIVFGTVISEKPLQINVEQKMTLSEKQLVLTRSVTEHSVDITVDHWTEDETKHTHVIYDTYTGAGSSAPASHKHAYTGRKSVVVHNGLKSGERVVLLRFQGGQKFLVLDRLE